MIPFYKILLQYTTIDKNFLRTFFKNFKVGHELDFYIKDIDVAKYLNINLITLRNRLNNKYSKDILYVEKVDYIKTKSNKYKSGKTYLLNYQGFERLSMNSDSKKSDEIRSYFIKIREFTFENQDIIYQSMSNYDELKKYRNLETIYFFSVDKNHNNIFKIGRTKDIVNRLRVYNVGRINEIDLKYLVLVKNSKLIEKCIKDKLFDKTVIDKKEIFKIDIKKLKTIIYDCVCKYMNKDNYDELYNELGDLLNFYKYNKKNNYLQPFIIINKM